MKTNIDIAKLLQWALRDELPKGRPVSDDIGHVIGTWGSRKRLRRTIGARPDIDAMGYVPGSPHEDAEKIASALSEIEGSVRFVNRADVEALFGDWRKIAVDAIEPIMLASFPQQPLVLRASLLREPRWRFGAPRPHQIFTQERNVRGELRSSPLVEGLDADGALIKLSKNRGRARSSEMYDSAKLPRSRLNWNDPSLISIGEARAEYVVWRQTLDELVTILSGALSAFEPVRSPLPLMPWIERTTQVRRLVCRSSSIDGRATIGV